ncbi:MAG: hypothetical protein KGI49_01920 [Patescibacteria group bacterium]|nr:hypothetical protein [Patescibacteria group bacterium]
MTPHTTPKDFFLHLGATVALYAVAIAIINLAFSVINYAFPDKLAGYFYAGSVIWPVSMLIILVPLLYVLEWLIARDIVKMPEKREVWVRRWRIYLTLFLTGATIIIDLIALLNTYLNGEITTRFGLKVLAVFVIAAVVFAYYILAKATGGSGVVVWRRILAWAGLVVTLGVIVGGFVIVGSPAKQRALRFDQTRVNDLTNIQWQVISYWQSKGSLPASLSDLSDSVTGFKAPTDPETGAAYDYTVTNQVTRASSSMPGFELCAVFGEPSTDYQNRGAYNSSGGVIMPTVAVYPGQGDNWEHQAGKTCFDRTIDPSKYLPNLVAPAKKI